MANREIVYVKGVRFESKAAALRHYGIASGTVGRRIRNQGMSFEEAISKPVNNKMVAAGKKKKKRTQKIKDKDEVFFGGEWLRRAWV